MDDAQVMHVQVDSGTVQGYLDAHGHAQLDIAFHVQHGEEAIVNELVHDHDVGDRGTAAHEKGNVWVPQNALHDNLVLNFSQQLVSDARVEDFFNGDWCTVEASFVNY